MIKIWAVIKYEYRKIVLKWTFLVATFLFPVIAAAFAVVPALIFSIKGEATRIVVVDRSGKIAARLKENLAGKIVGKSSRRKKQAAEELTESQQERIKRQATEQGEDSFIFVDYAAAEKSNEQIKRELNAQIAADQLDAYLIVPPNYVQPDANFEFSSRKAGDFVANSSLEDAVNDAVRSQRLADAKIDETQLKSLTGDVNLSVKKISEKGDEKDNDTTFAAGFIVGFMIYLTLLIYGQQIMAAVIEEKETRIAEILFSSAKPFELMLGKLVGVGLAGMTQLGIWIVSVLALVTFGLANWSAAGMNIGVPDITPLTVVYFFVFFLLGFFIYATIYALIGALVTTVQEGGQFALIPVSLLVVGLYLSFAVMRDPNAPLAVWASIAPFVAPLTMPVRIITETPPAWQIATAIIVNGLAIAGLVWLAAKIYRVGMLMYGKKATIPEVLKWIRQS